jgi:Flp pilus assembly protein TadD
VERGQEVRLKIDLEDDAVPRSRAREAPFATPIDDSPSDPYFYRGLRQMAEGDYPEAVLTLGPVALRLQRAGKEKEQSRVELYLGVAFMEMSRFDLARERFDRALALDGSLRLPAGGFSARAVSLFGEVRAAAKARP